MSAPGNAPTTRPGPASSHVYPKSKLHPAHASAEWLRSPPRRSCSISCRTVFRAVALALASVGLYAVMAFSVSQRQTEVGVRMAMGAEPGAIVRLILLVFVSSLALWVPAGRASRIAPVVALRED